MTFEQRSQWAYGIAALLTTAAYVVWLCIQLGSTAAEDIDYTAALLWTLGASFLIHAIGGGVARGKGRKQDMVRDDRDKAINQWGDAQTFYVFSGLAAIPLIIGLAGADAFWVTNTLFLAFALAAVFGVIAKSIRYGRGF
jgi:uncharacterized membrane protein